MVTVMPYERVLHYRHGRLVDVLEPGRRRVWGGGHDFVRIDTRVELFEVRPQEVPTADGVSIKVSASARITVVDPVAFHEVTADPRGFLYDAVKAWIRGTVQSRSLDDVVAGIAVPETPAEIVEVAAGVGLRIEDLAIRDVLLPAEIRRSAEQLIVTRQQGQVALEQARSEVAVLRALANSAQVLEDHPALASIRLAETAASHGGTVIIERPSA